MPFNSYIFILFILPISVGGYFLLAKTGKPYIPKLFLLGISLCFYGYYNIRYLPILLVSILANYALGCGFKKVNGKRLKKALLIAGIILNIGMLFCFKYFGFFVENVNVLFHLDWPVTHFVIPLGISIFTLQQISYVVDSYKGAAPAYRLLDYALFAAFFPQLVAGPISLHSEIIPQFNDPKREEFKAKNFAKGLVAFTLGLSKKVLLADMFGRTASFGFDNLSALNTTEAVIVILSFALQIYFDFSGYCDMAIGIGLFFNIKLPQNFDSPYRALNVLDFWKRWNMTLTRFMKKYVEIPIGKKKGRTRACVNLFLTVFLSGIWYGAGWTFALWGALHAAAAALTKLVSKPLAKLPKGFKPLLWLATFVFISITWVYFRAGSVAQANALLLKLTHPDFGAVSADMAAGFVSAEYGFVQWALGKVSSGAASVFPVFVMVGYLVFGLLASIFIKNTNERIASFKPSRLNLTVLGVMFIWSLFSLSQTSMCLIR